MPTFAEYKGAPPSWCRGCGNFAILNTLKRALVEMDIGPHQVAMVSGTGQAGRLPHFLPCNLFSGLAGRALPTAAGLKLVNPGLMVLAIAGDGDCYGEGGNHLVHAIRRNVDLTLLVHNNQIRGLVRGHASPTTAEGTKSKIQPRGIPAKPLNPLALAIALDCGFVARGFAGAAGLVHLKEIIKEAVAHPGFAMVDILQNCIAFNRANTFHWYKERVYCLEEGYDPADRVEAFRRSLEWGKRIPTGIFYRHAGPRREQQPPSGPGLMFPGGQPLFPEAQREIERFY